MARRADPCEDYLHDNAGFVVREPKPVREKVHYCGGFPINWFFRRFGPGTIWRAQCGHAWRYERYSGGMDYGGQHWTRAKAYNVTCPDNVHA